MNLFNKIFILFVSILFLVSCDPGDVTKTSKGDEEKVETEGTTDTPEVTEVPSKEEDTGKSEEEDDGWGTYIVKKFIGACEWTGLCGETEGELKEKESEPTQETPVKAEVAASRPEFSSEAKVQTPVRVFHGLVCPDGKVWTKEPKELTWYEKYVYWCPDIEERVNVINLPPKPGHELHTLDRVAERERIEKRTFVFNEDTPEVEEESPNPGQELHPLDRVAERERTRRKTFNLSEISVFDFYLLKENSGGLLIHEDYRKYVCKWLDLCDDEEEDPQEKEAKALAMGNSAQRDNLGFFIPPEYMVGICKELPTGACDSEPQSDLTEMETIEQGFFLPENSNNQGAEEVFVIDLKEVEITNDTDLPEESGWSKFFSFIETLEDICEWTTICDEEGPKMERKVAAVVIINSAKEDNRKFLVPLNREVMCELFLVCE